MREWVKLFDDPQHSLMKFCCQAFFDNWSSTINFVGILNCWLTLHPAGKILYSVKQNLFVDLVRVISRELILRDWSHTTCWYIELSTLTPHLAEKILYSVKFVAGFFFKELAMANAPTHAFLIITCFYQVCTDYQAEFFKKMQCSISVLSALFNFAFQTLHIAIVIHHNTQLEGEECIQKFPGLQSSVA